MRCVTDDPVPFFHVRYTIGITLTGTVVAGKSGMPRTGKRMHELGNQTLAERNNRKADNGKTAAQRTVYKHKRR